MNIVLCKGLGKMKTPELEKIRENQPQSQLIGEFLDWLRNEQDISLCILDEDESLYNDAGDEIAIYDTIGRTTERLLADFFGIDLNKAEKERQALLDEIRAANTTTN